MSLTLPEMLKRYLEDAASCADLVLYLAGFDIWNRWQDGDPQIEQVRLVIGEIDHTATLVEEGLAPETDLREAVRAALSVEVAL